MQVSGQCFTDITVAESSILQFVKLNDTAAYIAPQQAALKVSSPPPLTFSLCKQVVLFGYTVSCLVICLRPNPAICTVSTVSDSMHVFFLLLQISLKIRVSDCAHCVGI